MRRNLGIFVAMRRQSFSVSFRFALLLLALLLTPVFASAQGPAVLPRDYEADVRKIYKDDPDYEKKWPVEFAVRIAEGVLFDVGKGLSNLGTRFYDEFALQDSSILLEGIVGNGTSLRESRIEVKTIDIGPDLFWADSEIGWGNSGPETVVPGDVRRSVWTPGSPRKMSPDDVRLFWKQYINGYRFLDRLFFKVKKGSIPAPGTFDSTVAFEFAGRESESGSWRHDYGRANVVLTRTPAGWRISRFVMTEMVTERRNTKMFQDVTQEMIAPLSQERRFDLVARSMDDDMFLATARKRLPAGSLADMHGRASVVDIDQDGWDDLFVWDEVGESILLHNVQLPSGQRGFEDATKKYGLSLRNVASVLFADLNNDGVTDIVVGRWAAPSEILVGFRYISAKDQLVFLSGKVNREGILPSSVSSIAAADVNLDGYLDLYFATADQAYHYEHFSNTNPTFKRLGPRNVLLINLGGAEFGDLTERYGLELEKPTLAAAFSDYNSDGYPDLALANDFGITQLYVNENGEHFREVTKETGTGNVFFGMGLSWGDYDNDGDMDLYVTAMQSTAGTRVTSDEKNITATDVKEELLAAPRGNILLRNNGNGTFSDASAEPAYSVVRNANWAYGAQFADFDNDSYLDIFSPNGFFTYPRLGSRAVVRDF